MDPTGGIVSYVLSKLGDLIVSESNLLGNTRRDLEWVQRELRMMQAFLQHIATMKIEDARIKSWTEDLRQLAFHAEDVVDTFSLHVGNATRNSFLSCGKFPTISRHNFGKEIMQLRESVAELSRMRETYSITIPETRSVVTGDRTNELLQFIRLTAAPYVEDRDVVGFDRHIKAVTELLECEGSRRLVVSIVGMGGLGKTTLAKKVYNNLVSSFDCTAWVDVSQEYSIPDIILRISREILKLSHKDEEEMNQGAITVNLCELMQSKKHLIVLNDVWTSELWDTLDNILPDPTNRSRIIITTRNMEVARHANPSMLPYELSTLDEEASRVLFTKKVFPNEENPEKCCTGELASLREKIIKKCGGLPLAIVVVGGLLSVKEKSPMEWMKVAEKIDWHQTEKGEQCMGILALSYIDLPIQLRWCFLYLASFPEDCKASTQRLKRLWIAEGFIEEKDEESLEECAERYLEELVQRSLIQVVERTTYASVKVCRVHDLLLELAVSEAKKIRFLDVWRSVSDRIPVAFLRRLSFATDRIEGNSIHLALKSNRLRTLLIMNRRDWERGEVRYFSTSTNLCDIKWSSLRSNLKLLIVLELGEDISHLPEEIVYMVNLRYLALSCDKVKKLPKSVGNLQHLQTLDIGLTRVEYLPSSIWQIKTLRYLRGSLHTRLPTPKASLPDDTFKNLRALRGVRAGPWMETILPNLINLEELELSGVENRSMSRHLSSIVKKLQCLNMLILRAGVNPVDEAVFNIGELFLPSDSHKYLRSLGLYGTLATRPQFERLPPNLMEVVLANSLIKHNILELVGNLNYLRLLTLYMASFVEEKMVFNSGWFPRLRVLHLYHVKIKRWELEEQSLPLLRELRIIQCSNLEVLPEGLQHINTLKKLTLGNGPLHLHEKLQRPEGEDWYKIKHIEHIDIYR